MRSHIHRSVVQRARIESPDGAFAGECTMTDVSAGGARLVLSTSDPLPSRFFLILSRDGALRRLCQPVWQTDTKAGVQFIFKTTIIVSTPNSNDCRRYQLNVDTGARNEQGQGPISCNADSSKQPGRLEAISKSFRNH